MDLMQYKDVSQMQETNRKEFRM